MTTTPVRQKVALPDRVEMSWYDCLNLTGLAQNRTLRRKARREAKKQEGPRRHACWHIELEVDEPPLGSPHSYHHQRQLKERAQDLFI